MATTLNKTVASDEITGLRPLVKKAVVHIAHHFTKEIKKCENRKGDNKTKFQNRAAHLREEALALKRIVPDNVSKYALLMDFREREKILNDVKIPHETKVMVRIATHKAVQTHIEAFRKRYPDWTEKLKDLLENLGIYTKFKKKVKKQIEKSQAKLKRKTELAESTSFETTAKREGKKKAPHPKEENLSKDENIASDASGTFNEDLGNNEDKDENHKGSSEGKLRVPKHLQVFQSDKDNTKLKDSGGRTQIKSNLCDEISQNDMSSDNITDEDDVDTSEGGESSEEESEIENETSQCPRAVVASSAIAEVRRFTDILRDSKEGKSEVRLGIPSSDEEGEDYVQDEQNNEKVDDPFFVTEDNDFLKTAAVKRENGEGIMQISRKDNYDSDASSDEENSNKWRNDGNKKMTGNRAQRRAILLGRKPPKPKFSKSAGNFGNKRGSNNNPNQHGKMLQGFDKDTFGDQRHSKGNKSGGKWQSAAGSNKPEKNRNIFMGKKPDEHGLKFSSQDGANRSSNKFGPKGSNSHNEGEKLHPSWEAKRKQQAALGAFQGKKIKFDDD